MVHEIKIVAAVLSLIRGDVTASYIAESFGVTELQVHGWRDIFQIAGVVALTNAMKSGVECCELVIESINDGDDEPSTTPSVHPNR